MDYLSSFSLSFSVEGASSSREWLATFWLLLHVYLFSHPQLFPFTCFIFGYVTLKCLDKLSLPILILLSERQCLQGHLFITLKKL